MNPSTQQGQDLGVRELPTAGTRGRRLESPMPWFFMVRGDTEPCALENLSFRSHKSLGESPVTTQQGPGTARE